MGKPRLHLIEEMRDISTGPSAVLYAVNGLIYEVLKMRSLDMKRGIA